MSDKVYKPKGYRRRRCLSTAIRIEWQRQWGEATNGCEYAEWLEDRLEEAYSAIQRVRAELSNCGVVANSTEDELDGLLVAHAEAWRRA